MCVCVYEYSVEVNEARRVLPDAPGLCVHPVRLFVFIDASHKRSSNYVQLYSSSRTPITHINIYIYID